MEQAPSARSRAETVTSRVVPPDSRAALPGPDARGWEFRGPPVGRADDLDIGAQSGRV
jgi:hypothetical protein